jgi:hypothetical protein
MLEKKYSPKVFIPISEIELINSSKVEIPFLIFHSSKANKYLFTFDYRDDGLIWLDIEKIRKVEDTCDPEEFESQIDTDLIVSHFVEVKQLATAIIWKHSS